MGFLGLEVPRVHTCCGVVGLRAGAAAGALLGVPWAAVHAGTYCAARASGGAGVLARAHGALGVLLAAAHGVLGAGALSCSRNLCALYVRALPPLCGTAVAVAAADVTLPARAALGHAGLAVASLAGTLVASLLSLYLAVVVVNFQATLRS